MEKYKISILTNSKGMLEFIRVSNYNNFFTSLDKEWEDLDKLIVSDDCIEYDFEIIRG